MRFFLVALMLCLLVAEGHAATTICKVIKRKNSMPAFTSFTWDDESGKASVNTITGETFDGNMVFPRKKNGSEIINIVVEFGESYYGNDMAELVIFHVLGAYRVHGVQYVVKDGTRYVNANYGVYELECLSH
jgi:hypothetical protein